MPTNLIYKTDYFGFVYQWTDLKTNMKYIGSHYGNENDSYKGSNTRFQRSIKKRPNDFVREILEYVIVNNKKEVLKCEQKWLDTVVNIKDNSKYFNKKNEACGGWSFITQKHRDKQHTSLRKRQEEFGLSKNELNSYATKIKTRLDRIATTGFTAKEAMQHNSYSCQVLAILPDKSLRYFQSITKCSKELNIDARYGSVVTKDKGSYKGYMILRIQEPLIPCYRNNNEFI